MVEASLPEALDTIFSEILQSSTSPDSLQSLTTAGALKILELKQVHRAIVDKTESLRQATSDAKSQLDQSSLQLQNLLYEKLHYEKEIASCRAFKSAFSIEQLELIPLKEYTASVPDSSQDPHHLELERLEHELNSRKAAVKDLDTFKAKRDGLAAEVAQKRSQVAKLDAQLSSLRQQAQRVQKQFDIKASFDEQDPLVPYLPTPLNILYTHFTAAAAVYGHQGVVVSVVGEQAEPLRKQLHERSLSNAAMIRSPSAPGNAMQEEMAIDDKAPATFSSLLAVELRIKDILKATFSYIPALNLVTVAGGNSQQNEIIARLYETDQDILPPSAAGVELSTLHGHPYPWVQRAAGIDLLPPISNTSGVDDVRAAVRQYQEERRAAAVLQRLMSCCESF